MIVIAGSFLKQIVLATVPAIMLAVFVSSLANAAQETLSPPADPRQSITYWKSHTIAAKADPKVAKSHDIFSVLLRGWDNSRLEPGLYVVDSSAGPWAASLADGNILLSREAIDTCMSYGEQRGEHLLAFVLAHELAHQRADDLWHQRFFRMVGNNNPASRKIMLQGLQLDDSLLSDLEQKEAQADHDGLILMSSVGYDPYQIFDGQVADDSAQNGNDFFTSWVENIWQHSCGESRPGSQLDACKQAQSRALRTRAQLQSIATQATLYELGVQAFVARQYEQSREYFTAFGRDYPSRAVLSALGLTYLAEAQELHSQLIELGAIKQPVFYYPLMLDASAEASVIDKTEINQQKRANRDAATDQMRSKMQATIEQSIQLFEKALRLEPAHRKSYLLLATAHLLGGNTFMVRGVLQGRYLPKFSKDISVDLLLAMTSAIEGNKKQAAREFDALLDAVSALGDEATAMPQNLLIYSAYFNRAAYETYHGDKDKAATGWKQLARQSKTSWQHLAVPSFARTHNAAATCQYRNT